MFIPDQNRQVITISAPCAVIMLKVHPPWFGVATLCTVSCILASRDIDMGLPGLEGILGVKTRLLMT